MAAGYLQGHQQQLHRHLMASTCEYAQYMQQVALRSYDQADILYINARYLMRTKESGVPEGLAIGPTCCTGGRDQRQSGDQTALEVQVWYRWQ